jgi:DNA topoisomerase-1
MVLIYRSHVKGSKPADKKYIFTNRQGTQITDPELITTINKMAIPPMYVKVVIDLSNGAKIIYQGYDDKGRLQQKYSATHTKRAAKNKFCRLLEFGKILPTIQTDVKKIIMNKRQTRSKLIALIIQIIWSCGFRVGNLKYQVMYESHGISNIFVKHITQVKDGLKIQFIGKKSVVNTCVIVDPIVITELLKLVDRKQPSDYVFQLDSDDDPIKPTEINKWLGQYGNITSKDLRTFDVNVMFIDFMKGIRNLNDVNTVTKRKKVAKVALEHVSTHINNTPAICKKSYLMPDVYTIFTEQPRKYKKLFLGGTSSRVMFQNFLRLYCA